jgi:very-short-patch-repair endonuclease
MITDSETLPGLRLRKTARRSRAKSLLSKTPKVKKRSHLETAFQLLWTAAGGDALVGELKFHPTRKWRADFAHMASKTLIEIEGGAWSGGRHTRGSGFIADCEKYLEAVLLGWRVIRLAGGQVNAINVRRVIENCAQAAVGGNSTGQPDTE